MPLPTGLMSQVSITAAAATATDGARAASGVAAACVWLAGAPAVLATTSAASVAASCASPARVRRFSGASAPALFGRPLGRGMTVMPRRFLCLVLPALVGSAGSARPLPRVAVDSPCRRCAGDDSRGRRRLNDSRSRRRILAN